MLYTPEDVIRWKQSTDFEVESIREIAQRYEPGDRTPRRVAMFYQDQALVALSESDGDKAIAYFKEAVANEQLLWTDLLSGCSRKEALDSIRQMGFGPIIGAFIVSPAYARDTADLFKAATEQVAYPAGVPEFGVCLGAMVNGELQDDLCAPSKNIEKDVVQLANAFLKRDAVALETAVITGAESWKQYILRDKGWPNSVCYIAGLAFVRLARATWAPNFSVDHFLIPKAILSCADDNDYSIPIRIAR